MGVLGNPGRHMVSGEKEDSPWAAAVKHGLRKEDNAISLALILCHPPTIWH
jgi:hypothetical protein